MWDAASTEALKLSVRVSLVATAAVVLIGVPVAFWLARRRGAVSSLIEAFLSLPLVLPPVVMGYFLLVILSPKGFIGRWLDSVGVRFALDWKGAVVASGVLAFPLFLAVARVAFEKSDPRLEEAARTLNAHPIRVLLTITLPPALPGLIAATALAFARAFGEFGATMMLAGSIPGQTRTMPQAIYSQFLAGHQDAALGLALVSIAVGLIAMVMSHLLIRSHGTQTHARPQHA